MGRALKIQKTNIGSGTTVTGSPPVTAYNQNVLTDAGYPNFGSLTDPVYNAPVQTLDSNQFLGVVGGSPATSTASVTYPEIVAKVNVVLGDGSSTGVKTGRIIRQKGSHKFLVAATQTPIADGSFVVGSAYQISTLGTTTNWAAVGAQGSTVAQGDIFTATSVGGSGDGYAYPVGQCVLSNTATPTAGNMSIAYSVGDSAAVYASYITNKWVRDWNGMTYQNYSNSNLGTNVTSGENFYVTNFFTDAGTVTWSGADVINSANGQNGTVQLAQIASVTS
jgi:hypothetical protein